MGVGQAGAVGVRPGDLCALQWLSAAGRVSWGRYSIIIESQSFRLEKTSKIIKSNCHPNTTMVMNGSCRKKALKQPLNDLWKNKRVSRVTVPPFLSLLMQFYKRMLAEPSRWGNPGCSSGCVIPFKSPLRCSITPRLWCTG